MAITGHEEILRLQNMAYIDTHKDLAFESTVPFKLNAQDFGECPDCQEDLDEYERCSSCSFGHNDCEVQESQSCLERAMDRAELQADLARDAEMGL